MGICVVCSRGGLGIIALDIRGRYHMLITELRPYDEWGLSKSFPLQMMDLSAGLKFYFWD